MQKQKSPMTSQRGEPIAARRRRRHAHSTDTSFVAWTQRLARRAMAIYHESRHIKTRRTQWTYLRWASAKRHRDSDRNASDAEGDMEMKN